MAVILEDLRRYVGAASTSDDDLLQQALDASVAWIGDRIYPSTDTADVDQATLLLASKLYKRRQSPEGVAGFAGVDAVVRIAANDPDMRALLERHMDMSRSATGIGIG